MCPSLNVLSSSILESFNEEFEFLSTLAPWLHISMKKKKKKKWKEKKFLLMVFLLMLSSGCRLRHGARRSSDDRRRLRTQRSRIVRRTQTGAIRTTFAQIHSQRQFYR